MKKSLTYTGVSLLFTTISPGMYIMYVLGVFEQGILTTSTAISSGFYLGTGFMVYQLFRTAHKKFTDKDNPNIRDKAIAAGIAHATPWTLLLVFTGLVYFSVANIVTHILYITAMEYVGSFFIAKSKYWELKEREQSA